MEAAHVSDGLLSVSFESKTFANTCADLIRLGGKGCTHVDIGPSVLARCQERDQVGAGPPDCYILNNPPFAASVIDGSGPHRVVVFESDRHMLRCSKCSGRSYLCDHCKFAVRNSPPESIQHLNVELDGGDVKRVKQLAHPRSSDDLKAEIQPKCRLRIPWPPTLPRKPVLRCVPQLPSCSCGHTVDCADNCGCLRSLQLLPSVSL